MNKMKYLLLLAVCAMATGFMTSCLSSDDSSFNSKFTEEELNKYLGRLEGTYRGKLMFYERGLDKNGKDSMMLDSIESMTWTVTRDSTITILSFPESIYNNAIKSTGTQAADFRKVLENAPEKDLVCNYAPYKGLTQNNTVDYGFFVLPQGTATSSAVYTKTQITDNADKQYNIEYGYTTYVNDNYLYYQADGYLAATGYMSFMLIMKDVKCTEVSGFTTEVYPILLKGSKLY